MKPARNGVEGDASEHFSTNDGLDKPGFERQEYCECARDHAPNRRAQASRPTRSENRGGRPR